MHVLGYTQKWDMVPYDVQLLGAIAMHHGAISEMQTGEGKTLTATLPLYLNALTGQPVHLVTVNDYLVQRDCEWVGCILRWLGLTTGALVNGTPSTQRAQTYNCDVVYGTASEFGFDYLRDNSMATRKEDQVQRGHYFAIVDEIDSTLIDEARTPLIISGPAPVSRQMYEELKEGVSTLVRRQRDLCNRLATEAKKVLDRLEGLDASTKRSKQDDTGEKEALRKLWIVSKGTPRHKILKRVRENPDLREQLDKLDIHYHGEHNKQERAKALSELYIIVDEKASEYELTDRGIQAWQEEAEGDADDFLMLDLGHEYQKIEDDSELTNEAKLQRKTEVREEDAKRKERAHNLRQLLRAHLLMERDVDYIVQDNKVIIIDENTGRPQPGRRFSDGLHQAIEAKEAVSIQRETQTYATITLQNYFRMYTKLAGMSGTAITEANEFKEIYKLDVLQIPTNLPCCRVDANDEVYMTEREKYNAILEAVRKIHSQGRPILIGTESVDVSEKLSRIFRQNKLEHTVLNAKHHHQEAEIIAQAGTQGAITIATNMAGRGTDIKLKPGIAALGGLHVIGSTRHQSRRTDRQLRGRSARQGDPGTSKFYVSFEDQLMRLFASPRLNAVLRRLRPPEGEPISASILNRSIETAQKRIEQRNYTIRKHTLEYDDVMNKQRQEIYSFRNDILHIEDTLPIAQEVIESTCGAIAEQFFVSRSQEGGWDPEGYRRWLITHFPVNFETGAFQDDLLEVADIERLASSKIIEAFMDKMASENRKIGSSSDHPVDVTSQAMRSLIIRDIDQLWQEHLLTMDHLRAEVGLRAIAQKDPLLEFKHEAFMRFDELSRTLRIKIATDLFRFEIVAYPRSYLEQILGQLQMETQRSLVPEAPPMSLQPATIDNDEDTPSDPQNPKVGRNDFCPCGSGKKYKKCCGADAEDLQRA
jgi:preprotein translocase subunit SecA